MSKFIGRLCNIGVAKEAVRGVGVAPTYWVPKAVLAFDDKAVKVLSNLGYGSINQVGNQSLVAQKSAEGSIEGDIFDKSFGLFLLNAIGAVSSAVYSGAYKHTFTLLESNEHPSLTLTLDEPSGDLEFELAMIESLEITATPEETVKYTINFFSKSSVGSSGHSASYSAENKFLGRNVKLKVASLVADLDAATALCVKSLTFTIAKNLIKDYCLGTVEPKDILNKSLLITGSFEIDYENRTYANYMLDGTYRAMRIDIVNDDVTIGTTNPSLRFDLSRVSFDGWEPSRENDELATQTINFTALWDITNGNVINDCYLVNEETTY